MARLGSLGVKKRNQNHFPKTLHDFPGKKLAFNSPIYWNTDNDSLDLSHRSVYILNNPLEPSQKSFDLYHM